MTGNQARGELKKLLRMLRACERIDEVLKAATDAEGEVVNLKKLAAGLEKDIENLRKLKDGWQAKVAAEAEAFYELQHSTHDSIDALHRKKAEEEAALSHAIAHKTHALVTLEAEQDAVVALHLKRLEDLVAACEAEEARLEAAQKAYENFKKKL